MLFCVFVGRLILVLLPILPLEIFVMRLAGAGLDVVVLCMRVLVIFSFLDEFIVALFLGISACFFVAVVNVMVLFLSGIFMLCSFDVLRFPPNRLLSFTDGLLPWLNECLSSLLWFLLFTVMCVELPPVWLFCLWCKSPLFQRSRMPWCDVPLCLNSCLCL